MLRRCDGLNFATQSWRRTHVEKTVTEWMRARLHVGLELRGSVSGTDAGSVRRKVAERLSLPAGCLDLCAPGRDAFGNRVSARLSARAGDCRCIFGDQDV